MNDISVITREFGDISRHGQCPDFWVAMPDKGMPFIKSLKEPNVVVIGKSAGSRDIVAIEYGERQPIDATTDNLASALASRIPDVDPTRIFPAPFYGTKRRTKPVIVFQGAIHGGELTGTVASLNLCNIIETGSDLRGKPWPKLRELARKFRIVVVPWLNPDGTARWPLANTSGVPAELYMRCTQGVSADGTKFSYPGIKSMFPVPPEKTAFMGSYYNDRGVNLQYDFCTVERQPETAAWMRYYLAERPEAVVIWHCNAGSMIGPAEPYLPVGHQHETSRIGGAVRQRLLREGFNVGRLSWAGLPGIGTEYLNQINAVYHTSGAFPLMCELPAGVAPAVFTCDEMLDIGLIAIEEILFYASRDGVRPYELWDKVKTKIGVTEQA